MNTPIIHSRHRRRAWALSRAITVAATIATPFGGSEAQDISRLRAAVDSLANARLADGVPGLIIGVYRDTTPVLLHVAGRADMTTSQPLSVNRPMPVASVTKQFTAVAVMALVDDGRIELDAPASRYIPHLPSTHREATVRQLLHHTSGIGRVEPLFAARPPLTTDTVLRAIAGAKVEFAPGERFAYNNANYLLLGAIIEHVTGIAWDAYLHSRFFVPLGMHNTRSCAPVASDSLVGYMRAGGTPTARPPIPTTLTGAAGALCSTPHDLAHWSRALHQGSLLSPAGYATLRTPPTVADAPNHTYAMGVVRGSNGGRTRLWHNGALTSGFNAQLSHYPDDSLTIVVLANAYPAEVERVEAAAYLAWRGQSLPSTRPTPGSPAALAPAAFAGAYVAGPLRFEIVQSGDALTLVDPNGGRVPLQRAGPLTWRSERDETFRVLFDVEDGRVMQLRIDSPRAKAPPARRQS